MHVYILPYGAIGDFVKYCPCLLHLDLDSALRQHDGCGCVNDVYVATEVVARHSHSFLTINPE